MEPGSADESTTRPAPGSDDEDLLLRLTREHRDAAGLILALQRWSGAGAGDPAWTARELVTDLVRHSLAERIHLLPLVRRHLPGGEATAARIETGQQELEHQVQELDRLAVTADPLSHLTVVDALLTRHADELERHVFPALAAACPVEELRAAGARAAPREGAGLVDRIRNLFRS
jgi:hypothetical protein